MDIVHTSLSRVVHMDGPALVASHPQLKLLGEPYGPKTINILVRDGHKLLLSLSSF